MKNRRGLERSTQSILDAGLIGTALLIADVDHFKEVNDTHGHVLGDKVLRAIAGIVQANIKGRDIAARIGGDEFAALLPQTTLQGALALAEHIRGAVADGRIHRGDGKDIVGSVTLSIGVAVRNPGEPLEELMARADAAPVCGKACGAKLHPRGASRYRIRSPCCLRSLKPSDRNDDRATSSIQAHEPYSPVRRTA